MDTMFAILFTLATVGHTMSSAPAPKSTLEAAGMHCGGPRPLTTDARQTVRICEVRK